jgi:short-subunit dehydrogenase
MKKGDTMTSYVMISGATGGLGKAFAVECAARGYALYLTDLRPAPLALLAAALGRTYGVPVRWQACDLTESVQRAVLFETIAAERVSFWGLINVAGLDHEGLFLEQTRERIRTILRLNIEGSLELIHALLGPRDRATTFRIVNVASLAAFFPMPYKATYAASKRFLLDFSLALAAELAADDVTVTALCPAGLPTTPDCVDAIAAQGWLGQITTQNIGAVAAGTLDAALRGRPVYIPGALNRLLQTVGGLIPRSLIARLVNARWRAARQRPAAPAPQPTIAFRPQQA